MTPSSELPAPGAGTTALRPGRDRDPLLVIVGPTAVGKTSLSLDLALLLDGEVVSADSRLFYRGMDVGTAKPSLEERTRVKHHLIDIAQPDETVGLAQFQELATAAIAEIHARRKLPMLVGGSGQYVRAIVEGWRIPRVPPDPQLRRELEAEAVELGARPLHARLSVLDPEAAAAIDPRNVRRVIRALEVCIRTGTTVTALRRKQSPPYRAFELGLTMDRGALYARADRRVDAMMASGLEAEVRGLVDRGYTFRLPAMSGLGYAQFRPYLSGEATLADAVGEIKSATRRFIRQQYNWFRLDDPAIRWVDATDASPVGLAARVRSWLVAGSAH
jgi:tRNA dimethylallyltransferase